MAYKRGEPRVCSMVRPPTPQEEDRRRLLPERKTLTAERVRHVNRIKGLLFAQGVADYEPLRRDRRARLEDLRTGDGRDLPGHLKTQLLRELDRLELILRPDQDLEAARDDLLAGSDQANDPAPAARLMELKGVGPEFAASSGLNACSVTSTIEANLPPTPVRRRRPGRAVQIDHEQGVSKAGNPRLRATLAQLSWLWLRHQPHRPSPLVPPAGERNGGRSVRRRSSPWRASSWSHCGSTPPPAWLSRAPF